MTKQEIDALTYVLGYMRVAIAHYIEADYVDSYTRACDILEKLAAEPLKKE